MHFKKNGWLKCDNATKTAWCMCACEMVASCAKKYKIMVFTMCYHA